MGEKKIKLPRVIQDFESSFIKLAEASGEFFWVCDSKFNFQYITSNSKEIFGHDLSDSAFHDILDEVTYKKFVKKLKSLKEKHLHTVPIEILLMDQDGEDLWIELKAMASFDKNDRLECFFGMGRDITVSKYLETELKVEKERKSFAAKVASMVEMSRGIAHEINNPLTILTGKVDKVRMLLNSSMIPVEKVYREIDVMERNIDRISEIISSLREYSRDASHDPFVETPVSDIVEDVRNFCEERLGYKGIDLKIPPIDRDLKIKCRKTQICQVILNLINNSSDAIMGKDRKWIEINVEKIKRNVHISVKDCGEGISPDIIDRIFEPFFTTKDIGSGTGIGLSYSFNTLKEHGGNLQYDQKSANTKFVLIFKRV